MHRTFWLASFIFLREGGGEVCINCNGLNDFGQPHQHFNQLSGHEGEELFNLLLQASAVAVSSPVLYKELAPLMP